MGNGETTKVAVWARLFELWAKVCKLVIEGKRDPQKIIDFLQAVIMEKQEKFKLRQTLGFVTHPDGRRFRVEVYGHIREDVTTTSDERLALLANRGATLLGQLGLDLLKQQDLREKLPRGFWYYSFDATDRRCIPRLEVYSTGCCSGDFAHFECDWHDNARILSFVEEK